MPQYKQMSNKFLPLYIIFAILSFQGIGQSSFNDFSNFEEIFENGLELEAIEATTNSNGSGSYSYYLPPLWYNSNYTNPRYPYMYTSYDSTNIHIYTADDSIDNSDNGSDDLRGLNRLTDPVILDKTETYIVVPEERGNKGGGKDKKNKSVFC